ncbi:MAG: hypothetical protein ACWA66_06940 [Methylibium petroleiphilum]
MLLDLSRSLKVLAPCGVFIYVLGVSVRYGTGSVLGTVLAAIGVAVFLRSAAHKDARPHP